MRTPCALLCLSLAQAACTAPPDPAAHPGGPGVPGEPPRDALGGLRPRPPVLDASDQPLPVEDEDPGTLWHAYQEVDVELQVPAAGQVRFELYSDGSAEERAGNALPLTVAADGRVSFALRLGGALVDLGSTRVAPTPAERRLRFRARRAGGGVAIYIDRLRGGTWEPHPQSFGVDSVAIYGGRRVQPLEPRSLPLWVTPQPPPEPFLWNRAFDRMSDWKVYQRGPSGRGDLPLSFAYRAARAALLSVEVLKDGVPLGPPQRFALSASPGRAARALLPGVPQGGNYALRGTLIDAATGEVLGEDTVHDVAVGDVWLAIGQSNMSGFAPLHPPEPPVPEVHLFSNSYRWMQAREPMDSGEDQVDRVSEEFPSHGPMLAFAKEVSRGAGVPVGIIPGPRYGTNLDYDWKRHDERPLHRGTLYGSAVHRALLHGYPVPIRGVLWYQGEGNAGSGVENYLAQLRRHVGDLRRDLGGRVFFANCQLSTNGENRTEADLTGYLQPQEAQRRYVQEDPDSVVVALVDLPRDDPWHLNNFGIREAGRRLARAVLQRHYGVPQRLGPELRQASVQAGRRDVAELVYDKAMRGGDPALFRARDDAGAVQVAAVSVEGEIVRVQLRRAVQGTLRLSYGYSSNPSAPWLVGADGSGGALVFQDLPLR